MVGWLVGGWGGGLAGWRVGGLGGWEGGVVDGRGCDGKRKKKKMLKILWDFSFKVLIIIKILHLYT